MIKDCRVILNNEAVTVACFDNIEVQFPSIHRKADYVRVLYQDEKYKIVDSNYQETTITVKDNTMKRRNKKTTIKKNEVETPTEETLQDVE